MIDIGRKSECVLATVLLTGQIETFSIGEGRKEWLYIKQACRRFIEERCTQSEKRSMGVLVGTATTT